MLIITRRRNQSIVLLDEGGEQIAEITLLRAGNTSLGIDAIESIRVVRRELLNQRKDDATLGPLTQKHNR